MSRAPTDLIASRKTAALDALGLAFLFLLAILVSGPWGDFPVNDDWSFGEAARRLAVEHRWQPVDWTGMPLISHAAWGAAFCATAGACTNETLRWATIMAGAIGVAAAYLLAREVGLPRSQRLLAGATLAACPLFFGLAPTFMSDVSFIAMAAATAVLLIRSLKTASIAAASIGTALLTIAVLNRQLALFLACGFFAAEVMRGRPTARTAAAALPLLIAGAALVTFNRWMDSEGVTPVMYTYLNEQMRNVLTHPPLLAKNVIRNGIAVPLYVGLFALPMLLVQGAPRLGTTTLVRRVAAAAAVLFALTATAACIIDLGPMPVIGNVVTHAGLGPAAVPPYRGLDLFGPALAGPVEAVWWLVTAAAIFGGALIVERLILVTGAVARLDDRLAEPGPRMVETFILIGALAYCAPLLILDAVDLYDRYVLPLILLAPLLGANLSRAPRPRWTRGAGVALVVLFGLVSIAWTHDLMSWNRARWDAIARLQAQGVPASKLDGGFEFNGPRCFIPQRVCKGQAANWSEILDPEYMVSFEPVVGYQSAFAVDYATWLPPKRHQILALKRDDAPTAPTGAANSSPPDS
jgi:hypothetical protein